MFVERKTQRFLDALRGATGPKLHELTPGEARRFWALTQAVDVVNLSADIEDLTITGGPTGSISLRIVRPEHGGSSLPGHRSEGALAEYYNDMRSIANVDTVSWLQYAVSQCLFADSK